MRLNRTTVFTGIVVVVSVVAAAIIGGSRAEPDSSPTDVRATVSVTAVQRRPLPGEVRAGGFLRAAEEITVSAERSGRVTALPVAEGARVAAGAVVARLDGTIALANLARARVVARETALEPDVPAAEQARVQEALRVAEHEVALRSPVSEIAGVVERHHVEIGEHVLVGQPLVDVVGDAMLILDVDVDAEVVGLLAPGGTVPVHGPAAADGIEGAVLRVATRADGRTRRFRVEVALEHAPALRAGMHAEARFALPAGAPALYVPKAAVRAARGERGVFVVVDDTARWRTVQVAEVHWRPDLWRVEKGDLPDGTPIVVRGFSGLRDGARVEIGR